MIIPKGLFEHPTKYLSCSRYITVVKMSWLQNVFFTSFMSLRRTFTTFLSIGLRDKIKSLFSLKDKTRTPLVLFTREFATAGKTTSERLLETRQLDEMSMKTLKKIITSDKRGSKGAARAAKSLRWSV